ncbi:bifunctional DNA primase/polymerase [Synechococcus sp. PCC 7336]|uniref:bifunctional DNA primase/polymerase n=1 Tax=Synechococcus sp. PCC 7336 TaxID=195250 RepID=UPI0003490C09|nr:bifunctional DNA primase/polymerase [Synechococcus sp. PCC 7336]
MTIGINQQTGERPVFTSPLPSNEFSSLWYRWDFIEAPLPTIGDRPQWKRIKNFPLDPRPLIRRWSDPKRLIGVSFGSETQYCMVDIDRHSQYHPDLQPSGYQKVLGRLEEIGLIEPVVLTSSDSGGLHLYYPLPSPVSSYKLGHLLKHTFEKGGLTVKGSGNDSGVSCHIS